jgi:predicted CXXCH cytochrome family protein
MVTGFGLALIAPAHLYAEGGSPGKGSGESPEKKTKIELKKLFPVKPLENKELVTYSHAPFLQAECGMCHESDNRDKPGKLRSPTNKLCYGCHEPTEREIENHRFPHKPAQEDCTYCHNPHNSKYRFLLYEAPGDLCNRCHTDIANVLKTSKVKHDPTYKGMTCRNCHSSHASDVEHQLLALPSSLCLKCHSKEDIVDDRGNKLINIGELLKTHQVHHQPVDRKDCSACHAVHGSNNLRLLVKKYSMEFYAPYTKETYALCYTCHNKEEAITQAKTTTATAFRDRDRNLHTVHVVDPGHNRTCRVCHGEHATKQIHLMREDIPYGNQGWKLEINYRPTPTGGICAKTCHDTKEYNNK